MKINLLCIGLGYWILTKIMKTIIKEKDLETCTEAKRDLFMCDIKAREGLLTKFPKIEYNQVKSLAISHLIWKALENIFEGNDYSKNLRLKN